MPGAIAEDCARREVSARSARGDVAALRRSGVDGTLRDFVSVPLLGHGEWVGSVGAA
ncbi:hypothetical protein AB0D90_28845 [Streptomyces althioticus]|uniref:hypothetical protein n=1 Tax=Streptomyces althioticus TaxID=83380 RepID=UPI0033DBBC7A